MAILDILTYPDPRLKRVCEPVDKIDNTLCLLIEDMVETMYAAQGVGLAAPQVGHNIRVVVIDPSGPEERNDLRILINPTLELMGEEIHSEKEGCLSVPFGYRADVTRREYVRVQATGIHSEIIDAVWTDFPAIIVQHECDHLDGTLFIDHISRLRRTLFDAKVKKCQKRTLPTQVNHSE